MTTYPSAIPRRNRTTTLRAAAAIAVLLGIFAPVWCAAAEDLPSGKDVLDRYIEVTGGRAAYAKVNTRLVKATMEVKPMGMKGSITTYEERPNKVHAVIEIEGMGKVERGCDGDVFWEVNPMTGPRIVDGEERDMMLLLARFDPSDYADMFDGIECVGTEDIDGDTCYKVVMTPKKGPALTAYYSKESGLGVKTTIVAKSQFGEMAIDILGQDFKDVGGILMPHRVIQEVMNTEVHVVMESIEPNAEIPPGEFDLPNDVKALLEPAKEKTDGDAASTAATP